MAFWLGPVETGDNRQLEPFERATAVRAFNKKAIGFTRWPSSFREWLQLIAAAEINRLADGGAIALQELHGNERIAARAALHRLLGNGDGAAFGNQRDLPCDRGLMRQVFVNLLSNALKYTRTRHPAIIKISCETRDSERVIAIQDNGVGFDMRQIDKLFGVFQRLHVASEFEGNGVGLAMVARILHRHGGRAYAEGRVGEGATFWFTFEGLERDQVPSAK